MASARGKKRLSLALQGGGSHGAFTWGALDRLLEDADVEIDAVSGTSAGALNGAVLANALKTGSRTSAREALERFWRSVSEAGNRVFKPGRVMAIPPAGWNVDSSPLTILEEMVALVWSPYDNPFYRNVLEDLIQKAIPDFTALNREGAPRLFVCATEVKTNERKIFAAGEISVKALAASACLPNLFQAVEVNGQFYWDGGYMGNPALSPLLAKELPSDIAIVWINPLQQTELPLRAREIIDRLNDVTFNSVLVQEIKGVETVNTMLERGVLRDPEEKYKSIYLHTIADEENLRPLGYASKRTTDWQFLQSLRDLGRAAADKWLRTEREKIGRRPSADVKEILSRLGSRGR